MFFMGKRLFAPFYASVALAICTFLVACLDIPSEPETKNQIEKIAVFVYQGSLKDSVQLKINSKDSSALVAKVYPEEHSKDVSYFWYKDQKLLDSGSTYPITARNASNSIFRNSSIPNRLTVSDKNENSISVDFNVIVNAPPMLFQSTTPSQGDTLVGNSSTPILFRWASADPDKGQKLTHILEIDNIQYSVGEFTEVRQSGLKQGDHRFRVIVVDPYGEKDSTSWQEFYIARTAGAK